MKQIDLLITHKNCPDGLGSALACKHWHVENGYDEPEVIFVQYGDDAPDCTDKRVLMADFSFDLPTIEKMWGDSESFYIVDHHKTSEEALKSVTDYATFDSSKSGAVLTWEYFYESCDAPKLLLYIQDRDLWEWKLPESKEFSSGFRLYNWEFLNKSMSIEELFYNSFVNECIKEGSSILAYQNNLIHGIMKHHNDLKMYSVSGYMVPLLNSTHLISEIGNEIAKINMFSLQYFINDDSIIFSLRSVGDFDVAVIAKKYGGGGHKQSAGFSFKLNRIDLNVLFNTRDLDLSIKENIDDDYKLIGELQERGYSVAATEDIVGGVDAETHTYIVNNIESSAVFSLYEIKALLDNDKLTDNAIRNDIERLVSPFKQESGKPEHIML